MTQDRSIALQVVNQIVALIHAEQLPVGTHLPAQMLADRLRVSRSPVNEALALLHKKGIVTREKHRGFFVARPVETLEAATPDTVTAAYFQLAEDLLDGNLPMEVAEQTLRARYGLTAAQLNTVLTRIAREGWGERKPGYGWQFSTMLTTPDSLLQSYRMRLALEPAALLEPGYTLDARTLERLRAAEQHLLDGGIDTDTADQLHDRGVRFHEALVEASGNAFFIDAIRRVNRVRRLLSYRSTRNRTRYAAHARQHLHILSLLEAGKNEEASQAMRDHLEHTLTALASIRDVLRG
ncbi:GntR family transcriptional regulator [Cupriavidus plantarum]|uniref:GntR family transcriptional regulator n=1 Tax=Cupriavidus plantarum TaxID=942865 RepID=UPI000E25008D|nr:GntR family transcriptional regulator [Cupriavidus plantarum]REE87658.1 GntR family transcriptional regulator [Cupriavidus plantarum]